MATVPLLCSFPKRVQVCRFVDFSRQTGAHSSACESWAGQGRGAGSSAVVGSLLQPEGPHLEAFIPSAPSAAPQTSTVWCWTQAAQGRMRLWHRCPWGWLHPAHLHT